ncbi:hypothetical protein GOP47_0027057 [Adiantum capillus-veneris]|nr:hypothetical protein GOP47_0027057 [Adiantum capillus-veneris]
MEAVASQQGLDVTLTNAASNPCGHAKEEALHCALDAVELEHRQGILISRETLFSLLQKFLLQSNISLARRLYALIKNNGYASISIFQDHLIRLFGSCHSLPEALQVFSNVARPSTHTWHAIVSAYAKCGEGQMALKLFDRMQQSGLKPDVALLTTAFKACSMVADLQKGQVVHNQIVEAGVVMDVTIENALIHMYGKCNRLEDAHKVFDDMMHRDVVSWNALISSYVKHGHGLLAIDLFMKMCARNIAPCDITFSCLLKACSQLEDVQTGRFIHERLVFSGLESDTVIANTLIDMYAKCGKLQEAQSIFNCLQARSLVSWGAMISGYARQGCGLLALRVFNDMLQEKIKPNRVVLSCVLKACGYENVRCQGMFVHYVIIRSNLESEITIGNALVDMYIACDSILDAQRVFTRLSQKDGTSWNAMISGYAQQGYYILALELFQKMQQAGFDLCKPLALCIIKVCTSVGEMVQGMILHLLLVETGQESDVMIQNTLVDMYAKCGSLEDAQKIFDTLQDRNLVSWSALISGYAANRQGQRALDTLAEMQQEGKVANDVIYLSIMRVCVNNGELEQGRLIHDQIIRAELESLPLVSNMIIYMYTDCGSLDEGRKVFDNLPVRDVVSWGVMMDGCARNKDGFLALELFEKMQKEGIQPNKVIFTLVLKSCGITGSIEQGRLVHDQVIDSGIEADVEIGTTLIDMYGSCGSLSEACKLFNMLPRQDVFSWNALIAGYSQHGYGKLALQCFQDMQGQGLQPDAWTLTSVLAACSHEGHSESGTFTFAAAKSDNGLMPTMEHINCVIDNLSRVGSLCEAEQLLQTMPNMPNAIGWLTLLTAYRTFGSNMRGRKSFHEAAHLDSDMVFMSLDAKYNC